MIKVTLITNSGREWAMASEDDTPRSILESKNVNYGVGKVTIDSVPLNMGDMDKPLGELVHNDSCYLVCVVKADNAAEATVMGNACVITSSVDLADYELVKKYRPEALVLYKGEGSDKEPVYAVGLTKVSAGSMNSQGATFGPTASAEGKATITLLIDPDEDDVKQMLEDKIGAGLLKLGQIEDSIAAIVEDIHAEQASVRERITVL